ncbi:MAG TPA: FAD-binding oxidoreductase [Acidimicrobiales bacterium]|nr:FAD-binding oxidoreductase [Acidimicrobiales bacterium]
MERRRSWWGWGWEGQGPNREQKESIAAGLAARFGGEVKVAEPVRLEDLELPPPRVEAPATLAHCVSTSVYDRAGHAYGKSYRDVVRAFRGRLDHPPDLVAFPADEGEVTSLLDWASSTHTAVVPYGGGSSVVGGVECSGEGYSGVVSMDLGHLAGVLEVDEVSRAARIQAGTYGPVVEEELRPRGLTLRHFPQSFEFSTLGGWLATRSGGHYATVRTHIDDFVESMRVVTPAGVVQSRRLPGSGAGPSPDRMFLGSEGALGVITEAWMRLQDRPRWRASAGVRFSSYDAAVAATRDVAQSGLDPANCRLLDPEEAALSAGSGGGVSVLVLGFESADHPVDTAMARAVEICLGHGGEVPDGVRASGPEDGSREREGAVGTWRNSFIRAPYTRDALVAMSVIADTFETACTWDAFPTLHAGVTGAVGRALDEICGAGWITCRFTHVYPDGPAPYFSVFAPGRPGSEVSQWDEIKAAASEAVLAHGGTITHHHAVGRDHRPWYDRQRPDLFAGALRAAKDVLDPAGVLNPGVLIDPR